jgi:sortase (surface protein transpeptidase)
VVVGLLTVGGVACIGVALGRSGPAAPSSAGHSSTRPADSPPATHPGSAGTSGDPVLPKSAPVALAIPAIDVRAKLLRLGLTAAGELEVPPVGPTYDRPGWYRYSPMPGSLGPSVIVGHVDSATDGPSVFAQLSALQPLDRVRVTRADGSVAVFSVDDVRHFRKSRFPTKLVYGDTDHAALRLITCGGPFDPHGHYRDNVIVLASLVQPAA